MLKPIPVFLSHFVFESEAQTEHMDRKNL